MDDENVIVGLKEKYFENNFISLWSTMETVPKIKLNFVSDHSPIKNLGDKLREDIILLLLRLYKLNDYAELNYDSQKEEDTNIRPYVVIEYYKKSTCEICNKTLDSSLLCDIIDEFCEIFGIVHGKPNRKTRSTLDNPYWYRGYRSFRNTIKSIIEWQVRELEPSLLSCNTTIIPAEIHIMNRKFKKYKFISRYTVSTSDFVAFVYAHYYISLLIREGQVLFHLPNIVFILEWLLKFQERDEIRETSSIYNNFNKINIEHIISHKKIFDLATEMRNKKNLKEEDLEWVTNKERNKDLMRQNVKEIFKKLEMFDFSVKDIDGQAVKNTIDWSKLPVALDPTSGSLTSERSERKKNQISNIIWCAKKILKDGDTVVDFCGGGGHLSLVLAYLMPNIKVYLVDRNEVSLALATKRKDNLNLNNYFIERSDVYEWNSTSFQLGLAIHSCGPLTDIILEKCIKYNASYIIAPCCFGSIRNGVFDVIHYPRSNTFKNLGISLEEYISIASAADIGQGMKKSIGRKSMKLIDYDRNLFARENNYKTFDFTMIPDDCTLKNHVIVGLPITTYNKLEKNFSDMEDSLNKLYKV